MEKMQKDLTISIVVFLNSAQLKGRHPSNVSVKAYQCKVKVAC